MSDSPKTTVRSSASSPPSRWIDSRRALYLLLLVDVLLLGLGFYLLQEAQAHRANPDVIFFVDFPSWLIYPSLAAMLMLLPNLAVGFFVILRGLPVRRWFYVTTAIALILLAIVVAVLGPDDVLTIINPDWY